MAHILKIQRKNNSESNAVIPEGPFKSILMETKEKGNGRMWSFSLVFLSADGNIYETEFHSIMGFLDNYQIHEHNEIPEKELSKEQILIELAKC